MIQSRAFTRLLVVMGAAIAALALLAATASAREPAAGYERFAGCPSPEESLTTNSCQLATISGGHFNMGSKDVPISKPMTLSGGTNSVGGDFKTSPVGGLSIAKQEVPGGVIGITGLDWLINILNVEQLKLFAVTELVGPPVLTPTSLQLPLKVHLINTALGNKCYVGSATEPINLVLTTGTTAPPPPNEPITGKTPKFAPGTPKGVGHYSEGVFVDNSFAAPGANGCQLLGSPLINIDSLINAIAGVPSPEGTNETVQNFDLEVVARRFVYP